MLTVVCDGNSITFGVGYGAGPTWPQALAAMEPWASLPDTTFYNFGVNSQTTQNMQSDAATQIDPLFVPGEKNILIAWEIRNDTQDGTVGVTPRQAIDHMKAYCLARQAVGWKVIVINVLHSAFTLQGFDQAGEDFINANYSACNTILEAEWTDFADGYVDMMADSRLSNPHDGTTYYDGVHPNGNGRQYAAEDIQPELLRIYNSITPNVLGGQPSVVVAKSTISFISAGITFANTAIIFEVDGGQLKSYVPGRSINAISGFTADRGYYIVAKTDIDLSTYLIPPF